MEDTCETLQQAASDSFPPGANAPIDHHPGDESAEESRMTNTLAENQLQLNSKAFQQEGCHRINWVYVILCFRSGLSMSRMVQKKECAAVQNITLRTSRTCSKTVRFSAWPKMKRGYGVSSCRGDRVVLPPLRSSRLQSGLVSIFDSQQKVSIVLAREQVIVQRCL
ncbi:hypothetical protein KQX54_010217 [Cotesia glomerata]|uniref:Uncharacterized protein n=1 Tax=Cotesia glomerata TaxID=32391 RepID=A0AAV7ID03_COTGL|nr:hypothetical protein KQX54_010217 [Cotesia glomerata]